MYDLLLCYFDCLDCKFVFTKFNNQNMQKQNLVEHNKAIFLQLINITHINRIAAKWEEAQFSEGSF